MFVFVCLLLAGLARLVFTDDKTVTVLQDGDATLLCPHVAGDASWSRLVNGNHVTLASIANGRVDVRDERCGLSTDNTLVVRGVRRSDTGWFFCNRKQAAYLEVTTDPNMAATNAPGTNGNAADAVRFPSDVWKVVVGVAIGAILMLLVVLILRLWPDWRAGTNPSRGGAPAEVIYEEVEYGGVQPGTEPEVQSQYYSSIVTETPALGDLYSVVVNKTRTTGRHGDECVYSLTHNPSQTGSSQ
ncbi:hypothetical protein JOB18_039318 [Solea senegalensis]|uniref:Uncharacterized protein n=1 Tax=Solea senegalensis TaxID=28829 RepID=A0AAV6QEL0_SOLSE|nr:uncharacterized protein LOC122761487 [Solea senegalensis]XP_043884788.1 uncharacterized protein LOC122771332 [Solea senegalensis]KAG7453700.1 hypothetical protein JOB18_032246 [Solea senegalensis]KAG7486813.1 hypothetical protein JOB18_039318 [Solea senegalensis]